MRELDGVLWERTKELFYLPKDKWRQVDKLIYGLDDYFHYDTEKITEERAKAICESFKHHYSNNLFYNRYCKDRGVEPDTIKKEKDFKKIPLVPDKFFKDYPSEKPKDVYDWLYRVSSVDIGNYNFNGGSLQDFLRWAEERLSGVVTHSSGTSGNFSIMFRDKVTYQRVFFAAVKTLLFSSIKPNDDAHFVYPGPVKTYLTMGHWISKGTQFFDDDHRHFLTERELSMDIVKIMAGQISGFKDKMKLLLLKKVMTKGQHNLINLLEKLDKEGKQIIMLTFPFQLYDLMRLMNEKGKTLSLGERNSLIITGGGWKIYENKKLSSTDFAQMIEKTLGVPPENYKDAYGMSEMNGFALDCEGRYKHLNPWIYPMVLDDNMEPVGFGEIGRFAFLDPAAYSYPGFIMTGDKVKIHNQCPACEKEGVVMESDISRMAGAEAKGCGNLMRGLLTEELR